METSLRRIRQCSTQITPTVASGNDRKHWVTKTAFKYNKLLSYLGKDESTQDSGGKIIYKWLRNTRRIKLINAWALCTAVRLLYYFKHVSVEMVKHYVVPYLVIAQGTHRSHMEWIYFTYIDYTNYTLLIFFLKTEKPMHLSQSNKRIENLLNGSHPRIRRHYQITHQES